MSDFLLNYVEAYHPTGSNYICDPPVTDTDIDSVYLVKNGYEQALSSEGFQYSMTDEEYESQGIFLSWRKGNENYIVTTDENFYNKFVLATEVAKALNLRNKASRVSLFQAVLYGS